MDIAALILFLSLCLLYFASAEFTVAKYYTSHMVLQVSLRKINMNWRNEFLIYLFL